MRSYAWRAAHWNVCLQNSGWLAERIRVDKPSHSCWHCYIWCGWFVPIGLPSYQNQACTPSHCSSVVYLITASIPGIHGSQSCWTVHWYAGMAGQKIKRAATVQILDTCTSLSNHYPADDLFTSCWQVCQICGKFVKVDALAFCIGPYKLCTVVVCSHSWHGAAGKHPSWNLPWILLGIFCGQENATQVFKHCHGSTARAVQCAHQRRRWGSGFNQQPKCFASLDDSRTWNFS